MHGKALLVSCSQKQKWGVEFRKLGEVRRRKYTLEGEAKERPQNQKF